MTSLVACLSTGKGTWETITGIIRSNTFEKAILMTNDFGISHFKKTENVELIKIDTTMSSKELSEYIQEKLKGKIADTEVALNITSGTGREHLAILSALLKLGLGIRLVDLKDNQVVEL